MLRGKYSYKLTPNEVSILSIVIDAAFSMENQVKTRDKGVQLALCVILKLRTRLSVNIIGGGETKLSLNRAEAIAFHILYMKGYIVSNFLTNQIFTPIDKSI